MPFTESEKVEIRKFCGYPLKGNSNTTVFGWRFMVWWGALEFRLNNLSIEEEGEIKNLYLPQLRLMQSDLYASYDDLDTNKAAVWDRNPKEISDKRKLYLLARKDLCEFLGVPFRGPYDFMSSHSASILL